MVNLNQKIENVHVFLKFVVQQLDDILTDCPQTELLTFNVEAYILYTAIFTEIKLRIVQDSIMKDFIALETNPWTRIEH